MFDKLWNVFSTKPNKIKGHCRICHRPLFNLDTVWGMRGICVYCGEAYKEGKEVGVEKISDNDYGYVWYTNREELHDALTIDMMKDGYTYLYDKWLNAYRIYKPKKRKGDSFWGIN